MIKIPYEEDYWVQPGDTLFGISSENFLDIYNCNRELLGNMDPKGKANPHRILSGIKLKIPANTFVAEKVARAINAQRESKEKVLLSIQRALLVRKELLDLNGKNPEAEVTLNEAQQLAKEHPSYANINMIQAYELATQSEKAFRNSLEFLYLKNQMDEIKNLAGASALDTETVSRLIKNNLSLWPWIICLVIMTFIFGLVCFLYGKSCFQAKNRKCNDLSRRLSHHQHKLISLQESLN